MRAAAARLVTTDLLQDVPVGAPFRLFPAGPVAEVFPAGQTPARLGEEWSALVAEASEPNAFAEPWFVLPSLARLGGQDIHMLAVSEAGRLIGLLPLRVAANYGRLPVRNVQNWLHHHAFLGTPVVRAGHEQQFWSAVLDKLDNEPWASAFLHINGLVEHGPVHRGLAAAAWVAGRSCDTVHRRERALLASDLSPQAYYEQTVRKKKRKELKRLQTRLAELGRVSAQKLSEPEQLTPWCDAFLTLERAGWKGAQGSALGCSATTEAFFRETVAGAFLADRLDFLRLDLDGVPLAMLVNFITPPGAFSFKIAFDEGFARFSPGVLLQLENLAVLERPEVDWMDSCAVEDHPMINSLWSARRSIARVTVPLAGARRKAMFRLCRTVENASAVLRRRASAGSDQRTQDADDD